MVLEKNGSPTVYLFQLTMLSIQWQFFPHEWQILRERAVLGILTSITGAKNPNAVDRQTLEMT